eukprot:jgi/Mesen1/110/ME1122495C07568
MGQSCIKGAMRAAHRKGIGLIFPNRDMAADGNLAHPENGLPGDRVQQLVKHRTSCGVRLSAVCPSCFRGEGGPPRADRLTGAERSSGLSLGSEQPAQNWYGQGESDCLIKTKHCDGPNGC